MRTAVVERFLRNLARSTSVIVLACSDNATEPPVEPALAATPVSTSVVQGAFAYVTVTVVAPAGAGDIGVMVSGAPTGVTTEISNLRTTGTATTGTIKIGASAASTPGDYSLQLHLLHNGIPLASTTITLTVVADLSCPISGAVCAQWANRATGSTEYSSGDWAASQATGPSNVVGCSDNVLGWASLLPNSEDWLEVQYPKSVVPTHVIIYENFGTSSIVKVELRDINDTFHTVFVATPARVECPRKLTIDISSIQVMIYGVRISVDQRSINDWDEIDAVQLIGRR